MYRISLLFILLTMVNSGANASVYIYQYTGSQFYCGGPDNPVPKDSPGFECSGGLTFGSNPEWSDSSSLPAWKSKLIVDETLFPGGTIAGASIRVETFSLPEGDWWEYKVTSLAGSFSKRGDSIAIWSDFFKLSGDLAVFLNPYVISPNGFNMIFAADRSIHSSSGYYYDGGAGDLSHSSLSGDVAFAFSGCGSGISNDGYLFSDEICSGPGTWELISVTPSPIPLPAGIVLLLSGLLGLGIVRLRTY